MIIIGASPTGRFSVVSGRVAVSSVLCVPMSVLSVFSFAAEPPQPESVSARSSASAIVILLFFI